MRSNKQGFRIVGAGDSAEIYLYGMVGDQYDGVTDRMFVDELNSVGSVKSIDLRVNSPGGDVFHGYAIYNALRRHPAHVTGYVDGIAASMASVILMAADEVEIAENAQLMIHLPRASLHQAFTSEALRKECDSVCSRMDAITEDIITAYVERSGMSRAKCRSLLEAETYFTAKEAVAIGLADRAGSRMRIAACIDSESAQLLGIQRVPYDLLNQEEEPESEPDVIQMSSPDDVLAEVKTRMENRT